MRIGIDVSPMARGRTGVGVYVGCLLRELLQSFDADHPFVAFSSGRRPPELDALGLQLPHLHLGVPTRVLYAAWSRLGRPRIDRLLPIDLYHATNFFVPPVQRAARVVTFHDLAFLKYPEWASPKVVGPFSRGIRKFAQDADAIIACSQATKDDTVALLEVAEEKVTVVYEAADPCFAPMPREAAAAALVREYGIVGPFLLYVGTLEPRKNVLGILDAFRSVMLEFPHTLVLVGRMGWNSDALERQLKDASLVDRVKQIGYVGEQKALIPFYSAADGLLFPSFYEGFGLPLLEALSCGCPAITSRASSLPEVGGEAALYVDPGDPAAIAGMLRKLLGDASLQQRLRQAGPEQARRFSWRRCAQETLGVYQSVLA